ncbi:MAG: hypothetical protein ABR874_03390 [Candidatus Sulfotelmatobacter sp.]|jgi:hypothetical protein
MLKVTGVLVVCLAALSAHCQSASKYQVATIVAVKPHSSTGESPSDVASYDVSLKVDHTVYVVQYTPPFGMKNVVYAAGRDILVLVGDKTITYNDILGQSQQIPIVSRKPVGDTKPSK